MCTVNGWTITILLSNHCRITCLSLPIKRKNLMVFLKISVCSISLFLLFNLNCLTLTGQICNCVSLENSFHSPLLNCLQFPKSLASTRAVQARFDKFNSQSLSNMQIRQRANCCLLWKLDLESAFVKSKFDSKHDGECRFERKVVCLKIKLKTVWHIIEGKEQRQEVWDKTYTKRIFKIKW